MNRKGVRIGPEPLFVSPGLCTQQVGDLRPGVILVPGVGHGPGDSFGGLGHEAGQKVQRGARITHPFQPPQVPRASMAEPSTARVSSSVAGSM